MRYVFTVFLLLFMVGCGGNAFEGLADKNSDEAIAVEMKEALNDGDYDDVISELRDQSSLSDSEQIWLASAYLGKAGVDFINTLEAVDTNSDEAFDVLADTLGASQLDNESLASRRAYLALAFDILYPSVVAEEYRSRPAYCTGSEDLQMLDAIGGAIDSVLYIGETLVDAFGPSISAYNASQNVSCVGDTQCILLDAEWIDGLADYYSANVGDASTALINEITDADVSMIERNLERVECGVLVFAGDTFEDIKDDFNTFRDELCGGNGCTKAEIANYITNELN